LHKVVYRESRSPEKAGLIGSVLKVCHFPIFRQKEVNMAEEEEGGIWAGGREVGYLIKEKLVSPY